MSSLHSALSCTNTRDKKMNKEWAFSSGYNKGSVHCSWNQWENSSHMLSPSFAHDGKILFFSPTYFWTIYERNAVVFQLKQKAGADPSSFHRQTSQFLTMWSLPKLPFLWTVFTSKLSWVTTVPTSSLFHTVNALAWWSNAFSTGWLSTEGIGENCVRKSDMPTA